MLTLSVIIANYNNGKYLTQCVESIIDQTYKPLEVIIVDDCSTDSSRDIIDGLASRYEMIKRIYLEKNGGVSNARNVGIRAASGEYITILDADDLYYDKDKLRLEMETIHRYLQKDKDILAYSVTANIDKNGELLPGRFNRRWRRYEFIEGRALLDLVSMTKQARIPRDYCIKRAVIQGLGGYTFYKDFYEDLDLLMRIAEQGIEFYCTYHYGTGYRRTGEGLSNRSEWFHKETRREIQKKYYRRLTGIEKMQCMTAQIFYHIYRSIKFRVLVPIKHIILQKR